MFGSAYGSKESDGMTDVGIHCRLWHNIEYTVPGTLNITYEDGQGALPQRGGGAQKVSVRLAPARVETPSDTV